MIVETTTFRLRADVDQAKLIEADARVQTEFFHRQSGFLRRTTARSADGHWIAVTLWYSHESAEGAAAAAGRNDVARAFAQLIDDVEVRRYESLD